MIGGYISDGMNIIVAGSTIIKNALGITGIIILFSSLLTPTITMLVYKFCLELTSALIEPVCEVNLTNFLSKLSSILTLLISVLVVCSMMYLILIAMIMSTSNMVGTV